MPTSAHEVLPGRQSHTPPDHELLHLEAQRMAHLVHQLMDRHDLEPDLEPPEQPMAELEQRLQQLREGRTGQPGNAGALSVATLSRRCELEPLDVDILLLCGCVEIDSELRSLVSQWPGLPGYRPTVRFVQNLWEQGPGGALVRQRFSVDSPLMRAQLLTLVDRPELDDSTSGADTEIQVPERVVRFLLGEEGMDPFIRTYCRIVEPSVGFEDLRMPRTVPEALEAMLAAAGNGQQEAWWSRVLQDGPLLLLAVGPPGAGRFALCEAVAARQGRRILEVDLEALGAEAEEYGLYLSRIFREATLQQAMPVFVNCRRFVPGDEFDSSGLWILGRKMDQFRGPVALCLDKPLHFHELTRCRRVFRADLDVPPALYRRELWAAHLPQEALGEEVDLWALAKIFNFGGGGIKEMVHEAANRVLLRDGPAGRITTDDLMSAGRELQSRRMGKLTKRMLPRVGLEDLVVSERVRKIIQEIVHTVRYRHIVLQDWGFGDKLSGGKGMSALFSGPPGTGKSMAAQVISRECGMNLFRVNLAMVISKYVGETEERLSKVFEQARESHSILLFDEADALFSKRSKVKSAQDKYANLEVNFLLQEVEAFEGIVILTTNLEAMIDKAFLRRINFRVFFPKPDTEQRVLIWKAHVPPRAPFADDIDWYALAEDFDITGGYIKNAMLRAAQWAAEREGIITHDMLCKAAEAEMAETGRVIREIYQ